MCFSLTLPYAAWSAHNEPLPTVHHTQVRRLIADAEHCLGLLDQDIATESLQTRDVHSTSDALLKKRENILDSLNSLRKVIAPHRQLPSEILVAIFALCIPESITVHLRSNAYYTRLPFSKALPLQRTSPWNLLIVCARWRRLILNTPVLWSNITFRWKKWSHYNNRHPEIFNQVVGFSGSGMPLQLCLKVDDGSYWRSPTEDIALSLGDLVVCHAHRLRRLSLSLPIPVLEEFLALPPSSLCFDRLEIVNIEYHGRSGVLGDINISRHVFRETPRLRKFVITAELPLRSLELPWEKLEELHFCGTTATAEECCKILQLSTSLVDCSFSLRDDLHLTLGQMQIPLRLTNIKSFNLNSNTVSFLECLHFPSLESLALQCDIDRASSEGILLPFLSRSPCLTKLVLLWWIPSDTLKMILQAVPCLRHLQFAPGKTGEVVKLLWTVNLLPNLESLVFLCYPAIWEEVVEIIGLRGMTGQLRNVHITTFFRKEVDGWEKDPRLQTLREIGMTLRLSHIVQGRYS